MSLPAVVQLASTQERLKQVVAATPALITEVSLDGVLQRAVQISAEIIATQPSVSSRLTDARSSTSRRTASTPKWWLRSARRRGFMASSAS